MDCRNGGTCIDTQSGFTCQCHDDFTGEYCTETRRKGSLFALLSLLYSTFRPETDLISLLNSEPEEGPPVPPGRGGASHMLRVLMLRMKKNYFFLVFNVFKIFVKIFVHNDC